MVLAIEIVAAFLLPPLAVFLRHGIGPTFWIAVLVTVLFWVPGIVFALVAVAATRPAASALDTGPRLSFALPAPMRLALDLAREAAAAGEVPVGAVVTRGAATIATSANMMRMANDPTAHAEIVAIRAASAALGSPRLDDCVLWATLEPCAMCAGAIMLARLAALHYAAPDPKGGAILHGPRLFSQPTCHHRPEVYPGLGEAESATLLRDFFAARR